MTDASGGEAYKNPDVFSIFVMVVTFVVGVPGNFLVLWITSVKMRWTVNTIWFWNLAVADVICCLSLPFSLAQLFYEEWLYGPILCKFIPVVVLLNMFASVFTLVAISVDRCILVIKPVWAQNHRHLRMAWMICLTIWILSFLMCLPAALYRKGYTENNMTFCVNDFDHTVSDYADNHSYYDVYEGYSSMGVEEDFTEAYQLYPTHLTITVTRMVFGFLIPFVIITASYLRLAFKVQNPRFLKAGRKTTKVVFGIVVAFFITWAPYHILGMIRLYFHNSYVVTLDNLSVALAYFNSCINPILYVFMGKDMRSKTQQSIRRLMESAFSEEVSRSTERTKSKVTAEDSATV
ncbi:C3a anaphylatoxin chemotactic receptor [Hyperolius riggenbachi]|uniref:C3a anaphylatoxin chemotactic receptor n=1 Tax=Hyperolius riggenbachi TaxID=752182 RepID=UPI0035A362D2